MFVPFLQAHLYYLDGITLYISPEDLRWEHLLTGVQWAPDCLSSSTFKQLVFSLPFFFFIRGTNRSVWQRHSLIGCTDSLQMFLINSFPSLGSSPEIEKVFFCIYIFTNIRSLRCWKNYNRWECCVNYSSKCTGINVEENKTRIKLSPKPRLFFIFVLLLFLYLYFPGVKQWEWIDSIVQL